MTASSNNKDLLTIAGKSYQSRLLVGTGKYKDLEETRLAIEASGAEIVTVAVRRTNIGQNPGEPNLLDVITPDKYTILAVGPTDKFDAPLSRFGNASTITLDDE